MRYKGIKLSIIFLLIIGLSGIKAQESVSSTGGNGTGSGGTVNYTIGQIVYTFSASTTGSVAQGVQQPFEISVVGIDNTNDIILNCSVYPNPTSDFLKLNVGKNSIENLSYQIYDISGKLLENNKVTSNEIIISMKNFVPAIYFLKVLRLNNTSLQEIKTFKIIKN